MSKLLTQNGKIKKTSKEHGVRLYNFGIPALYSPALKMKTCPNAGACAAGCYAQMGAYKFSNVASVFEWRLKQTLNDGFINAMLKEIDAVRATHVRIHDAGDFYSAEYLARWIRIIEARPLVKFYAYTKQVELFKHTSIPPNLRIIFSFGGKQDAQINKGLDVHSLVFESIDALNAAGYTDCSKDDLAIFNTTKVGLIYHGTKSYENTRWGNK